MKQVLVCVVVFLFVGCLQIFGAEKEIKAVGVTDSGVLLLDDECTFALYENGKEAKVDSIRWKVYNRTDTPGGFMQFKESAEPVFRYKVEAGAYKRNLDILTRIDAPQGGDVYFQTVVGCTYWEGGQGKSLSLPFYVNLLPSASAVINPLAISWTSCDFENDIYDGGIVKLEITSQRTTLFGFVDIPCEGEDVGINWCFPVFAKTDTASLMFWDSNQFYTRFYVQNEFGVVKMDKDTIRLRDLILLSDIQIPPATSEEVSFYPNPVIDHLYFQDNVENISVYSVQGTLLLHLNSSTKQVDLTSLSSGMYILQYQIKGSIVPIRKQIIKK